MPPGATAEQVAIGKKIFHGEVAGGLTVSALRSAPTSRAELGCSETEALRASPIYFQMRPIRLGLAAREHVMRHYTSDDKA